MHLFTFLVINEEDYDFVTLSREIEKYPSIALCAFASEFRVPLDFQSSVEKWKIVHNMMNHWLKEERELNPTSTKSELAKKLMKLHNVFEEEGSLLEIHPQIKFNVLARRLDIQGKFQSVTACMFTGTFYNKKSLFLQAV